MNVRATLWITASCYPDVATLPEKRAAAKKAEADFFALLKQSGLAKPGAVWKEVSALLASSRCR